MNGHLLALELLRFILIFAIDFYEHQTHKRADGYLSLRFLHRLLHNVRKLQVYGAKFWRDEYL